MYKASLILSILCLFTQVLWAGAPKGQELEKAAKKYRSSMLVEMSVEKTVKSELLGKLTKYDGKIYFSKGKFRWENFVPEESIVVFDGKTIWSVQMPPKEFGGPVQVAKGIVDGKNRSHILISSLLGADLKKNFKILSEKNDGDLVRIEVQPLREGLTVKSLSIAVNKKEGILSSISYLDDLGNLTTMSFSKVKFLSKEKKKLFKYQPPKDAQVTNL